MELTKRQVFWRENAKTNPNHPMSLVDDTTLEVVIQNCIVEAKSPEKMNRLYLTDICMAAFENVPKSAQSSKLTISVKRRIHDYIKRNCNFPYYVNTRYTTIWDVS